jgi:signal transduction histidine kinase/ActR/RegA family two-component response regulator
MNWKAISSAFPQEYLHAALMVSLLSVWLLVGLFAYLNRYTKRDYFTIWTAAWLFYALWLTMGLNEEKSSTAGIYSMLKESCVAISAVFLLWGSAHFLGLRTRQTSFGLFMLFLLVWIFVTPHVSSDQLRTQLPMFILIGLSSVFAGVCFYRLRKKMPFVGAGMLSLGFLLWGLYLVSYPLCREHKELYSVSFFAAAVLQLFIAVSMIVLVLEEVRYKAEQVRVEIEMVRSEKEALQARVITTEEQCRNLYDQVRLSEGVQKAYDELRRTQEVVVQHERLRALGQMASGVAHDVNNALCPVIAYTELLQKTLPDLPDAAQRDLQIIRRAGEDIANIVKRLREFYRRRSDTEELACVDVNELIEQVIELTRPRWRDQAQRGGVSIQIRHELQPDLPRLAGDPGDLREALINLIFNAVDATPQSGSITLVTRSENGAGTGQNASGPPELVIEVRDTGTGMDEKTRQRCMEPFFSTKAQRGGTGLGLAMVYGMMQRHEGSIEIESKPGSGTCVRLTFPIREGAVQNDHAPAQGKTANRSLRILCIDDEPQIQTLLRDCLTDLGHRVTTASGGREGVEAFRAALSTGQAYETVITDLGMPEVDGHQVARAIKAESPGTPVVMLTGWGAAMKEDGETAPEVNALLGKPTRISELNELLQKLTASSHAGRNLNPARRPQQPGSRQHIGF